MRSAVLVRKVFYALLIPTILMNIVTCVSSAADTIIVGNILGESSLAAITFSTPVFMLINTVGALVAVGGTTAMSIAGGRGDKHTADGLFSAVMVLCVVFSAVIGLAGVTLIDPVVNLLGAAGEMAELTREYTVVVFYMTPAYILNITLAFLVRGDGRPNLAMAGMFMAIISNILLDLVFIIYLKMGVAGAAWGTGVSQAISAVMLSSHFLSKRNRLKFVTPALDKAALIIKSGAGTSLHFVYQFVTILVLNNLIMIISGAEGIVVYTGVMNVSTIAMSIFEGLSQTVQPMFAIYHGENNNDAIKDTFKLVTKATVLLGGAATLLLELFPFTLIRLFGIAGGAAFASAAAIRIFSICIILMTLNVIMGYYYQSTGRSALAAVIVVLRNLVMLLIGAVIFGYAFGINGVWVAYVFAECATFIVWYTIVKGRARALGTEGGILLLPVQVDVYERELANNLTELHKVLVEIKDFLSGHGISELVSARVVLATDELTANVIKHGSGGKLKYIEVRIALKDEIMLTIRDDGVLFDHSAFTRPKDAAPAGEQGITLIRKTASSFEYMPVLGLNRTLLTFARKC